LTAALVAAKTVLEDTVVDLGKILEPREHKVGENGASTVNITERFKLARIKVVELLTRTHT
jgi:hypothetical protein